LINGLKRNDFRRIIEARSAPAQGEKEGKQGRTGKTMAES